MHIRLLPRKQRGEKGKVRLPANCWEVIEYALHCQLQQKAILSYSGLEPFMVKLYNVMYSPS